MQLRLQTNNNNNSLIKITMYAHKEDKQEYNATI
jgi:hypothetical protein